MKFHGTARVSEIGALLVPKNCIEFHGTTRVSEFGALQVTWNSMESVFVFFNGTVCIINTVSLWIKLRGYFRFPILMPIIFSFAV